MLQSNITSTSAKWLEFTVASNNFIHPSQLGGLKFKSTADASIALTHIVQSGWAKRKATSSLAFNISQFFPSLNHHFLILILEKAGLDPKVVSFFSNYLTQRSTKYLWNNFLSPPFEVNVGVGQGSALSPILSSLYLSPLLFILENRFKNLNIPISILFFVDDGLFIVQGNLSICLIRIFFAVIIFFLNFLTVLVSLLNIPKLKFFISVDPKVFSILLPWIFLHSGDQHYNPKTHGDIWGLSSTKNYLSTSTLTITLTKQYLWSSAWSSLEICLEALTLFKNVFYIDVVLSR